MATDLVLGVGEARLEQLLLVEAYPAAETQVDVAAFSLQGGGTAATALATLATLGNATRFVAKVADDYFGRFVLKGLVALGIDTRGAILQPGRVSPSHVVLVEEGNARPTVLRARGDVDPLTLDELPIDPLEGVRLLLVDGTQPAVALALAGRARAAGVPVVYDASGPSTVLAELTKVEVRLSRQAQMIVVAPRAGTIVRVLARQGGDFVKVGDPLARFVPATAASAVELWVDGNDVPLIQRGRAVRLQFEGWPAVQFSGWPSVAVGTFGARVAFVDAAADANGRFRVVVRPDARGWPGSRFLRQGARAHGWILLNRVSLGYELWRRLNGFPPIGTPPPAGTPGAPTASKGA